LATSATLAPAVMNDKSQIVLFDMQPLVSGISSLSHSFSLTKVWLRSWLCGQEMDWAYSTDLGLT